LSAAVELKPRPVARKGEDYTCILSVLGDIDISVSLVAITMEHISNSPDLRQLDGLCPAETEPGLEAVPVNDLEPITFDSTTKEAIPPSPAAASYSEVFSEKHVGSCSLSYL